MSTAERRVENDEVTWPQTIARVLRILKRNGATAAGATGDPGDGPGPLESLRAAEDEFPRHPPILVAMGRQFGLNFFEREVLAFCVAARLNPDVAELCRSQTSDPMVSGPTVEQALALLSGAHWAAFAPDQPLRYWRLTDVELAHQPAFCLLRLDERIFLHLLEVRTLDGRLAPLLHTEGFSATTSAEPETAFEATLRTAVTQAFSGLASKQIHLVGPDLGVALRMVSRATSALGLRHLRLNTSSIPGSAPERLMFTRLWTREVRLDPALLTIMDDTDGASERREWLRVFLEGLETPSVLVTDSAPRVHLPSIVRLEVPRATRVEKRQAWERTLTSLGLISEATTDRLASQFNLEPHAVTALGRSLEGQASEVDEQRIRQACRAYARPALDTLAQRIAPQATWEQLILPDATLSTIRQIESQVRHRGTVYERWGFSKRSDRGLGITALFSGLSGTGKTFAAEVLGSALDLDLYRIDLSGIVSKYIGETEKNLRRIFDTAEGAGAILLFDEADALFGQRSEVKDSHDRYANLEISYLLQRMEAYQGLAILTTNLKNHLDPAFLRRLRFVIQFPFPDATQRAELWRRAIPAQLPVESLDFQKLARPALTGGNIQTIAINAAFIAAEDGTAVTMACLRKALMRELGKLDRPVPEAELRDWT